MNLSIKIGYLTRDPEKVQLNTEEKTLVKLVLAVNSNHIVDGVRQTNFFNIAVWNNLAKNCLKFLKKGSRIAVFGEDQIKSWEDKDGNKRTVTEILAKEIEFLSTPKDKESNENDAKKGINIIDIKDEDLPF